MNADLVARGAAALGRTTGDEWFTAWSPGRVNLIGDHIDYSGGLVLPMALDRGTRAVVFPRRDDRMRGYSANFADIGLIEASLHDLTRSPTHHWFAYILGVIETARRGGLAVDRGFDLYLEGNIPEGGGLSSSASVEMVAAVSLERIFSPGLRPTDWALLAQRAENEYIGVSCGIMDQLAIARGRRGSAILMDCDTLECEFVSIPEDRCSVIVANTNQPRTLAGSEYNDRRRGVERAAEMLADSSGAPVDKLVDVTAEELEAVAAELSDAGVLTLARHTITEQQRVIAAATALRAGDRVSMGQLMRASHESLRDDFQVTGPALDALAEAAWATDGVIGARMTGAGFGGCTVNLVERGAEASVMEGISGRYSAATGVEPELFVVSAASGAEVDGASRG